MDKKTLASLDEALAATSKAARILDRAGFDTAPGLWSAVDALREAGARARRKPRLRPANNNAIGAIA
jgi:hypothetical protein